MSERQYFDPNRLVNITNYFCRYVSDIRLCLILPPPLPPGQKNHYGSENRIKCPPREGQIITNCSIFNHCRAFWRKTAGFRFIYINNLLVNRLSFDLNNELHRKNVCLVFHYLYTINVRILYTYTAKNNCCTLLNAFSMKAFNSVN